MEIEEICNLEINQLLFESETYTTVMVLRYISYKIEHRRFKSKQ